MLHTQSKARVGPTLYTIYMLILYSLAQSDPRRGELVRLFPNHIIYVPYFLSLSHSLCLPVYLPALPAVWPVWTELTALRESGAFVCAGDGPPPLEHHVNVHTHAHTYTRTQVHVQSHTCRHRHVNRHKKINNNGQNKYIKGGDITHSKCFKS